jgi:hypothetical protein
LKNIRNFVFGSSLLLAAWLTATFLQEVPSHRYPTLGRPAVSAEAQTQQPVPVEKSRVIATALGR